MFPMAQPTLISVCSFAAGLPSPVRVLKVPGRRPHEQVVLRVAVQLFRYPCEYEVCRLGEKRHPLLDVLERLQLLPLARVQYFLEVLLADSRQELKLVE